MNYEHGTMSQYRNKGCRCDKCKEAMTVYNRNYRNNRLKKRVKVNGRLVTVLTNKHGTEYAYQSCGCRCDLCKKAHTIYYRNYRERRRKNGRV